MTQARDLADGKFDTNTLVVDATNDFVGINTTTQAGWTDADDLVITNASGNHAGMTILNTNTSNNSVIAFADGTTGDAAYRGAIEYLHGDDAMRFRTGATERLRVLSGGGLTFNGDTATANALDDYEEGTWTPTWSTGSATYQNQYGFYTKIGNVVNFNVKLSSTNVTSMGTVSINGLPFTSRNTTEGFTTHSVFPVIGFESMGDGGIVAQISLNSTSIELYIISQSSNENYTQLNNTHIDEGGAVNISVTGFYYTDA